MHVVGERDVERFLQIVPGWPEASRGVRAIVLASGDDDVQGFYSYDGVLALCAWSRVLEQTWTIEDYESHAGVLARLGVPIERDGDEVLCRFDRRSAMGFQLMHILLHEIGHHLDRMCTRLQRDCPRGEPYAERFANEVSEHLWERYFADFGW